MTYLITLSPKIITLFFVFVSSIICTHAIKHFFNSVTDIAVAIALPCTVTETCTFYIVGDFFDIVNDHFLDDFS